MSPRDRRTVVGAAPGADDGLLLPRPPGVLRRFWARHPRFTDALVAIIAFLLSAPSAAFLVEGPLTPTVAQTWYAVILILLGSGALMFRRTRPVTVFAATLVPVVILPPGLSAAAHLLPAFAIYAIAAYRSVKACWIAFGAASAIVGLYTLVACMAVPTELQYFITSLVVAVVGMLIAALIGINVGNRRRYLEALIDRSRQLLVERDQQAQLAAAAERTRIAREMHDIVSHNLTVVVALAEGASATPDPERARAATQQIATTARGALTEMRAMLGVLRAPDPSQDAPLTPAEPASVADAVEAAQRAGFPVVLRVEGAWEQAPADTRFAVIRIVQESLTNAMRHSWHATTIDVRVSARDDRIDIEVVNDGVRTAPVTADPAARSGFGILGLRERVAHVGGSLQAGPVGEGRWGVRATLPWERPAPTTMKETTP